jgi:hypothetical protein
MDQFITSEFYGILRKRRKKAKFRAFFDLFAVFSRLPAPRKSRFFKNVLISAADWALPRRFLRLTSECCRRTVPLRLADHSAERIGG